MIGDAPRDTILLGDALEQLQTLPDECVQTVITSPPYWGLRDYGTARWIGGDASCDHRMSELRRGVNLAESSASTRGGAKKVAELGWLPYRDVCGRCGAMREDKQLGLEQTLDEYMERIVSVFCEVRRVLRADGTAWVNVGDCCASDGKWGGRSGGKNLPEATGGVHRGKRSSGLKAKDLVGLPWMIAFALRAQGWYLRSDIIWHKPNPMPESVTDRPTRAHEYVFLLAKSERYYYDGDAIREPLRPKTFTTYGTKHRSKGNDGLGGVKADNWAASCPDRRPRAVKVPAGWDTDPGAHGAFHREGRADKQSGGRQRHAGVGGRWDAMTREEECANGAARRSVWAIAPARMRDAHFATFPPALVEPCVAAGSRPGDLVLDPFMGAGMVAVVCAQMGRSYLGVELNPAYVAIAERRLAQERQPMLLYSPRRGALVVDEEAVG